jgi:hypothetical protein
MVVVVVVELELGFRLLPSGERQVQRLRVLGFRGSRSGNKGCV